MLKFFKKKWWLIPTLIILLYLATHLHQLTLLPVFADEAIYIRWAQLIIDDWQQYLFFPLNDGKTPLFFWLLVPWQFVFSDQLWAARFVSVLIGLLQMFSLAQLVKILGGKKVAQWLSMLFVTILPFWYFHHRLALTDGLLALTLTWVVIGTLQLIKVSSEKKLWWALTAGLSLGLALWSKLPALLLLPALPFYVLTKPNSRLKNLLWLAGAVFFGLVIFISLKLHPAFSQLFGRGSDFLFPWQEVILNRTWQQTVVSWPTYLNYFASYLTWSLLVLNLIGLFASNKKLKRHQQVLILSALIFTGPIALLGRVVYPRYYLPISIFLTAGGALSLQVLIDHCLQVKLKIWKKIGLALVIALLVSNIVSQAGQFIYAALTNPAKLPLVSADQEQYLHKWSAGYGVKPSVTYVQQLAQDQSVAVATEGSFGTLPDGALLYLHRQNVDQIYLEGIGYPVEALPQKFVKRAKDFDRVLLLVNQNRLQFELEPNRLLKSYCRPHQAPCLQIWDITDLVETLPQKQDP